MTNTDKRQSSLRDSHRIDNSAIKLGDGV